MASAVLPWRRSGSKESVYSIQEQETDFVRDTSDSDMSGHGADEYEPMSSDIQEIMEVETSGMSDEGDIIRTHVLEVRDDGGILLADSELTAQETTDSELDYHDYWLCANCRTRNNVPHFRYCTKCFEVRKNIFPPRPKPKSKRSLTQSNQLQTLSQDSDAGFVSLGQSSETVSPYNNDDVDVGVAARKRAKHHDAETDSGRDSDNSRDIIKELQKSLSDPEITIDKLQSRFEAIKKKKGRMYENSKLCITCCSEPKTGVFVHGKIAHICCCYKCAVKVWRQMKRCPICNCKVSNVLRGVVI